MKRLLLSISTALIMLTSVTFAAEPTTNNAFTPQQKQAIEKIIHQYLVKNPNVLVEASRSLQQQQMAEAEKAALGAISKNKQALFANPATPSVGSQNPQVVLVEFFDYQCGHCKAMNDVIQKLVKQDSNLKVVFKELPIFGANSRFAAKMALAAAKQNKYYEFHDALLAAKNPLTPAKVKEIAKKVGLNLNQLLEDMKSKAINDQLRQNFQLAQELKLVGTPAFVIANKDFSKFKYVPGATSFDNLQQQIKAVGSSDS